MTRRRLLISFSGGETSGYMTWLLLSKYRGRYDDVAIVFANTSEENEQTLEFVDECDRLLFAPLGARVTYIEAVQQHGVRKRAAFRQVTFETAARDGSVYQDMVRKYGIPNNKFSHCTRDLKLTPIRSFAESLGWLQGTYDSAVGIRADEIDRMATMAEQYRIIYPLIQWEKTTKPMVNAWFAARPFRLRLKGYQGNCKWCWKKSDRKLFTLIAESPEIFDFPRKMEAVYPYTGAEFRKPREQVAEFVGAGYRRTFFRKGRGVDELFAEAAITEFTPAEDDSVVYDIELDQPGGCGDSESCEAFSDEMLLELAGET